jgi:hypothetical protein
VGSSITLKGTAEKENGQLVGSGSSAFITASLTEDISSSDIVKDGQFTVNFEAPETTHAGDYTLIVKVYDKDERGNILNSGSKNIEFKVIQKPAKIDIAFDKKNTCSWRKPIANSFFI